MFPVRSDSYATYSPSGEIRAPKGTKVTVVAHLSEDVYEAAIEVARESVIEGASLSQPLKQSGRVRGRGA